MLKKRLKVYAYFYIYLAHYFIVFITYFSCLTPSEMLKYFQRLMQRKFGLNISEFTRTIYRKHVEVHTSTGRARIGIFENHIEPVFGNLDFEDISKVQIYDWRNSLVIRGYKPAMINKIQIIFGQIIKLANDLDVTKVRREDLSFQNLKITGQPVTFLNTRQMQKLILCCEQSTNINLFPIVKLLALTGARKREVLDLRWACVSIDHNYFTVPKSKNGSPRKVYLNEISKSVLQDLRENSDLTNPFVFPNPHTGKPYTCIHHAWDIARVKAGFPTLRIHDLRHSFASALVNKGVEIYDVQQLLGHQSVKTTQRYAHLDDRKLKASVDQVSW